MRRLHASNKGKAAFSTDEKDYQGNFHHTDQPYSSALPLLFNRPFVIYLIKNQIKIPSRFPSSVPRPFWLRVMAKN
jgi:hypothetical protein